LLSRFISPLIFVVCDSETRVLVWSGLPSGRLKRHSSSVLHFVFLHTVAALHVVAVLHLIFAHCVLLALLLGLVGFLLFLAFCHLTVLHAVVPHGILFHLVLAHGVLLHLILFCFLFLHAILLHGVLSGNADGTRQNTRSQQHHQFPVHLISLCVCDSPHFGRDGMIQDMGKSFRGTRAYETCN